MTECHHPTSCCLDVNQKQHSQTAEKHWHPNSWIMTFTKKLTRDVKKGRRYSMTEGLVVTRGPLVTKNQSSSATPWRISGSRELCLIGHSQKRALELTQWTFKEQSTRELRSTWDQGVRAKYMYPLRPAVTFHVHRPRYTVPKVHTYPTSGQ